ncbi:MAG: AlpA family phage regulatory protein [Chitinophagaceae bacterium]|nr:MAG: AlpA family phage regulatory protein [Chitinophagaceae bacterium]
MPQPEALLRLPQVLSLFPISRSSWLEGVRVGLYPAGIKLSARAVAWRASDIYALISRLTTQ